MVAMFSVLAACQTTNTKLESISPQGTVVFDKYVTANNHVIVPLPDGAWTVAGSGFARLGYENPFEQVMLIRRSDDGYVNLVEITSSVAKPKYGWKPASLCQHNDMYSLHKVANSDGGLQDCWGVEILDMDLKGDLPDFLQQTKDFAEKNGMKLGFEAGTVSFSLADKSYFLRVSYLHEPYQKTFNDLDAWGASWYQRVKSGFDGK
jgi:hypothetical protein